MNAQSDLGETSFADGFQDHVVADLLPFVLLRRITGSQSRAFLGRHGGMRVTILNHDARELEGLAVDQDACKREARRFWR